VSLVRESIAAGVPEHVRVRLEGKLGLDPGSLDHAGKPGGAEEGAYELCNFLGCRDPEWPFLTRVCVRAYVLGRPRVRFVYQLVVINQRSKCGAGRSGRI
jgi:hypothetical protein